MDYDTLKHTRRSDRLVMVEALRAIADEFGVSFDVELLDEEPSWTLTTSSYLYLSDIFDAPGFTGQECWRVLTWGVSHDAPNRDSLRLNPDIFHEVNPHHGRKCNVVLKSFSHYLANVRTTLRIDAEGRAILRNKEAQTLHPIRRALQEVMMPKDYNETWVDQDSVA